MPKKTAENLRDKLLQIKQEAHLPYGKGLSSGSTLINLTATGRFDVCALPGDYMLWVGDSGSGKSFMTRTMLAEAAVNPVFKDYRIIDHDAEQADRFDYARFFPPLLNRLEPLIPGADPEKSVILEDYWDHLDAALAKGPCVVLTDSMDALVPRAWLKKAKAAKKAAAKGEESSGSYGTDKAKINSERLRLVLPRLQQYGSVLIIISQTRDRIGFGSQFDPKTRGGGNALTFYSHLELWTSVRGQISRTVRLNPGDKGRPVEQGVVCRVKCKKNRTNGRKRSVDVRILHSVGIDDLGSMVEWLCDWGHWDGKDSKVKAPEFDFEGGKEKLIAMLEADGQEDELRGLVAKVWNRIEDACTVSRKPRYT